MTVASSKFTFKQVSLFTLNGPSGYRTEDPANSIGHHSPFEVAVSYGQDVLTGKVKGFREDINLDIFIGKTAWTRKTGKAPLGITVGPARGPLSITLTSTTPPCWISGKSLEDLAPSNRNLIVRAAILFIPRRGTPKPQTYWKLLERSVKNVPVAATPLGAAELDSLMKDYHIVIADYEGRDYKTSHTLASASELTETPTGRAALHAFHWKE